MIDDAVIYEYINGLITHCLWYITDSTGDRITQNGNSKIEEISQLDVLFLMLPPNHLIKIITLANNRLRAHGHGATTKCDLIKFLEIIIIGS